MVLWWGWKGEVFGPVTVIKHWKKKALEGSKIDLPANKCHHPWSWVNGARIGGRLLRTLSTWGQNEFSEGPVWQRIEIFWAHPNSTTGTQIHTWRFPRRRVWEALKSSQKQYNFAILTSCWQRCNFLWVSSRLEKSYKARAAHTLPEIGKPINEKD